MDKIAPKKCVWRECCVYCVGLRVCVGYVATATRMRYGFFLWRRRLLLAAANNTMTIKHTTHTLLLRRTAKLVEHTRNYKRIQQQQQQPAMLWLEKMLLGLKVFAYVLTANGLAIAQRTVMSTERNTCSHTTCGESAKANPSELVRIRVHRWHANRCEAAQ